MCSQVVGVRYFLKEWALDSVLVRNFSGISNCTGVVQDIYRNYTRIEQGIYRNCFIVTNPNYHIKCPLNETKLLVLVRS